MKRLFSILAYVFKLVAFTILFCTMLLNFKLGVIKLDIDSKLAISGILSMFINALYDIYLELVHLNKK